MKERFLPLDPNLGNLKETDTPVNRHYNWTLICRELRKFGIIVDPKNKDKLVIGDQSLLKVLLPMLIKYEQKMGKIKEFKILEIPNEPLTQGEDRLGTAGTADTTIYKP